MLIRIIKSLPAPLMDGFDVRGFRMDHVYQVEHPVGRYLIVAGYAEPMNEIAPERPKTRRPR
jgi:hypothetical protein